MVLLESNSSIDSGSEMKAFDLPDTVSGKNFSSEDIDKKIVLVAFICNHCPYVIKIIEGFSQLAKKYSDTVQFIAISANDPDYTSEDSPENMTKFAKENDFSFPYLFDETQEIAKAYGAVCTPDIYVYKDKKLAYHGRFEDLEKALLELGSGNISFEQLPSIGCSIKWAGNA